MYEDPNYVGYAEGYSEGSSELSNALQGLREEAESLVEGGEVGAIMEADPYTGASKPTRQPFWKKHHMDRKKNALVRRVESLERLIKQRGIGQAVSANVAFGNRAGATASALSVAGGATQTIAQNFQTPFVCARIDMNSGTTAFAAVGTTIGNNPLFDGSNTIIADPQAPRSYKLVNPVPINSGVAFNTTVTNLVAATVGSVAFCLKPREAF